MAYTNFCCLYAFRSSSGSCTVNAVYVFRNVTPFNYVVVSIVAGLVRLISCSLHLWHQQLVLGSCWNAAILKK